MGADYTVPGRGIGDLRHAACPLPPAGEKSLEYPLAEPHGKGLCSTHSPTAKQDKAEQPPPPFSLVGCASPASFFHAARTRTSPRLCLREN